MGSSKIGKKQGILTELQKISGKRGRTELNAAEINDDNTISEELFPSKKQRTQFEEKLTEAVTNSPSSATLSPEKVAYKSDSENILKEKSEVLPNNNNVVRASSSDTELQKQLQAELEAKLHEIAIIKQKIGELQQNSQDQVANKVVKNSEVVSEEAKKFDLSELLTEPNVYDKIRSDADGVVRLSLIHTKIGDERIGLVVRAYLKLDPNIVQLNIVGNKLSTKGLKEILNIIDEHPKITGLDISSNNFKEEDIIELAKFLSTNRTIQSLDTGSVGISLPSVQALFTSLHDNNILKELRLGYGVIGDQEIKIIMENLADTAITHMNLGASKIGIEGARHIAEFINKTKLVKLGLGFSQIGDAGMSLIFQALKDNDRIEYLDISRNDMTNNSVKDLAEMISKSKSLKYLNIERNDITEEGAVLIGEALQVNKSVEHLRLGKVIVGDKGMAALAKALVSEGSKITKIEMIGCQVGDEGAKFLVEALETIDLSSREIIIDLEANEIETEYCRLLGVFECDINLDCNPGDVDLMGDEYDY